MDIVTYILSFVHCTVADNVGALLTGGLQAVESNPIIVNIRGGTSSHGSGMEKRLSARTCTLPKTPNACINLPRCAYAS